MDTKYIFWPLVFLLGVIIGLLIVFIRTYIIYWSYNESMPDIISGKKITLLGAFALSILITFLLVPIFRPLDLNFINKRCKNK